MRTVQTITYRTPDGVVLTDAMESVESFRRFRGFEDEIIEAGEPFEWNPWSHLEEGR